MQRATSQAKYLNNGLILNKASSSKQEKVTCFVRKMWFMKETLRMSRGIKGHIAIMIAIIRRHKKKDK